MNCSKVLALVPMAAMICGSAMAYPTQTILAEETASCKFKIEGRDVSADYTVIKTVMSGDDTASIFQEVKFSNDLRAVVSDIFGTAPTHAPTDLAVDSQIWGFAVNSSIPAKLPTVGNSILWAKSQSGPMDDHSLQVLMSIDQSGTASGTMIMQEMGVAGASSSPAVVVSGSCVRE